MEVLERVEAPAVAPVPSILDPRVERGAALLDEKMPGWAEKVDVDALDLEEPSLCVLGQIGLCVNKHNTYCATVSWLFGRERHWSAIFPEEFNNGFVGKQMVPADWDLLEQDWRLAILARRTTRA